GSRHIQYVPGPKLRLASPLTRPRGTGMTVTDWVEALNAATDALAKRGTLQREYLDANIASVEQLIRGIGPDDTEPSDGAGACIVVNIAAEHVPSFCELS